ncbi:hypothetical protein V6N13_014228 [Hibiscus sabdariffa]|uniref:Uncharacterized protein n=2 Tax=Hibiscus sabdariffa TaxID=183260 RepID=A0ABR1ZFW5_9ROSI
MQAPSRRRRNAPPKKDLGSGCDDKVRSGGSGYIFSVIADMHDPKIVVENIVPVHHSIHTASTSAHNVTPIEVSVQTPMSNRRARRDGKESVSGG